MTDGHGGLVLATTQLHDSAALNLSMQPNVHGCGPHPPVGTPGCDRPIASAASDAAGSPIEAARQPALQATALSMPAGPSPAALPTRLPVAGGPVPDGGGVLSGSAGLVLLCAGLAFRRRRPPATVGPTDRPSADDIGTGASLGAPGRSGGGPAPTPPPLVGDASADLVVRSITHEFRQSLSLISGYTELLARAPDEPTRAQLLDDVRQATKRLASSLTRLEHLDSCSIRSFGAGDRHKLFDLRAQPPEPPPRAPDRPARAGPDS
jgi:hypothetical protein